MTAAACTTTPWSNHLHCLDQILMNSPSPALLLLRITRFIDVDCIAIWQSTGSSCSYATPKTTSGLLQAVLNHNRCWTMYSVFFSRCFFSIESVSIDKPNFSHIILISCSLCLKIATWVITTNNLLSVFDQLSLCVTTPSVISATEFCQNIDETLKSWYMTDISALQFVKCCRTLHIALFLCSSP